MSNMITIALTKGRILNETLPLFADAGIQPLEDMEKSRKLIFPTNRDDVRFLLLRGVDVPTYVRYGAADMGVSGKDMLLEEGGAELYEPLDLNIAKCRLMTAGLADTPVPAGRVRVATKFVNVAKDFYARQGVQVDVIKLYGAMELAPIMGLCDRIVDIVDTGNTLRANGLVPMEHIADVSTRLVVNKAALKMKHQKMDELIKKLAVAVDARK